MIREDWKTAQNILFDQKNDFEFKLSLDNVEFTKLPVQYEASIASFKEKVDAEPPTNFDDMVPYDPLEKLDYEIRQYKKREIPANSDYVPLADQKPKRSGCEVEQSIRGPRGDPFTFGAKLGEHDIEIPKIDEAIDYKPAELVKPHPKLNYHIPLPCNGEADSAFCL